MYIIYFWSIHILCDHLSSTLLVLVCHGFGQPKPSVLLALVGMWFMYAVLVRTNPSSHGRTQDSTLAMKSLWMDKTILSVHLTEVKHKVVWDDNEQWNEPFLRQGCYLSNLGGNSEIIRLQHFFKYSQTSLIRPWLIQLISNPAKIPLQQIFPIKIHKPILELQYIL